MKRLTSLKMANDYQSLIKCLLTSKSHPFDWRGGLGPFRAEESRLTQVSEHSQAPLNLTLHK